MILEWSYLLVSLILSLTYDFCKKSINVVINEQEIGAIVSKYRRW